MHQHQSYTSHGTEHPRDRRRDAASVDVDIRKLERSLRELGPEGVRQGRLEWMPFHWLKAVRGARL
jgi:hypothetical protein